MRPLLTAVLILALSGVLINAAEDSPTPPNPDATNDGAALHGPWRRPDGGYVIEITQVSADGQLNAAYFNPRPIKVESAQWRFGGGLLQIRVRLNDTGYEGAYYLLQYDPATDRLVGEYHPANQETFEVVFERLLGPTAN